MKYIVRIRATNSYLAYLEDEKKDEIVSTEHAEKKDATRFENTAEAIRACGKADVSNYDVLPITE